MHTRSAFLALAAAIVLAAPAGAQSSSYRSATAQSGKPVRIAVVTPLKKDCSVGQVGGVKVLTPPKNGVLNLRTGKLKTPSGFRCPNVEVTAEAVFYQSKPNFVGTDEVVYETKSADGAIEKFSVRIEVGTTPPAAASPKKDAPLDL